MESHRKSPVALLRLKTTWKTSAGKRTLAGRLRGHRRCLLLRDRPRPCRQLQDGSTLAIAQTREQDNLPVGKLERVVMRHGVVHVDLPKTRKPLTDFLIGQNAD